MVSHRGRARRRGLRPRPRLYATDCGTREGVSAVSEVGVGGDERVTGDAQMLGDAV